MRFLGAVTVGLVSLIAVVAQPAAANPVTPFSVTDNGLTVNFTSTPNPNGFVVGNFVSFVNLHGNTLIEYFDSNNQLTIDFSQPLSSLQADVSISLKTPGNLDYMAYSGGVGGTMVASGSVLTTPPLPDAFDEGLLQISAVSFDTIVLSTADASEFAIDNLLLVTADPPSTHLITFDAPEPLTLALFGAGLAGAGALRRRRKASASL